MEWEPEAKAAIDRAPFFVRRFARKRVEEQVQTEGRRLVTLADVKRAKEEVGPNPLSPFPAGEGGTVKGAPAKGTPLSVAAAVAARCQSVESVAESADSSGPNSLPEEEGTGRHPNHALPADGVESDPIVPPSPAGKGDRGLGLPVSLESIPGLTEDQIRLIERLVDQIPGQESRYWSAKSCGGAVGCPLTLVDARTASDALIGAIMRSGLSEAQAARLKGPVLSHHRLKAAVAGCPNCCSEPQIKDFALVARARPSVGPGGCIQCGSCEAECKEGAVSVASGAPVFDLSRCVGCGACAEVCEPEAIVKVTGYDVLVGGRLGRRPRLAATVAEGVRLEEAIAILQSCLDLLVTEGLPGERLGTLLDRVGWERIDAEADAIP